MMYTELYSFEGTAATDAKKTASHRQMKAKTRKERCALFFCCPCTAVMYIIGQS